MRGHLRLLTVFGCVLLMGDLCSPNHPNGETCIGSSTCNSGVCGVSGTGHCCNSACKTADAICGATACDQTGACVYPTTAIHCDSCLGSVLTTRTCDGMGGCGMGHQAQCPNGLSCQDATSCQSMGTSSGGTTGGTTTGGTSGGTPHIYLTNLDAGIVRMDDVHGTGWTAINANASGSDSLVYPWGIYVDADGGIYVTDTNVATGTHRVVKTDITGTTWITLSGKAGGGDQFTSPEGISVDSAGYIYVTDGDRIVQTSLDGTTWNSLGTSGSGTKQFSYPGGVYVDSSYIYVADRLNNRIVQTTMAGTPWNVLTGNAAGTDNFNGPRASRSIPTAGSGWRMNKATASYRRRCREFPGCGGPLAPPRQRRSPPIRGERSTSPPTAATTSTSISRGSHSAITTPDSTISSPGPPASHSPKSRVCLSASPRPPPTRPDRLKGGRSRDRTCDQRLVRALLYR
jgi:hypothetical protein